MPESRTSSATSRSASMSSSAMDHTAWSASAGRLLSCGRRSVGIFSPWPMAMTPAAICLKAAAVIRSPSIVVMGPRPLWPGTRFFGAFAE